MVELQKTMGRWSVKEILFLKQPGSIPGAVLTER